MRLPWRRERPASDDLGRLDRSARQPDQTARLVLREALMDLPARQRAVLVLRYWDDLPINQIAEVLGCPTGTAKSLGARGIQALRRRLGPDFAHGLDFNEPATTGGTR